MLLHPDFAALMVAAEQERLAELARRPHPRSVASWWNRLRRRPDSEGC